MKRNIFQRIGRLIAYAPPLGILVASSMNLTVFERQYLMLLLLVWVNMFFLLKSWLG
ncbi:MAG TPA: hypothetical protein VLZ89_02100 [Anaerolineales bacterium]|nr:hypothetical protein [Anaerolineales bacterium]